MQICFRNMSKIEVRIGIEDKIFSIVKPYEVKTIDCLNYKQINILIHPTNSSKIKTDMFHIVLKTNYTCTNVYEGKVFTINREKIRFSYNAFYERLFLDDNDGTSLLSSIAVMDELHLRKCYKRACILKGLYQPFDDLFGPPMLFIGVGVVLSFTFGWKFAILYFLCLYLFLVLVDWFGKRVIEYIFKKGCKFDEKKDFNIYLSSKYIWEYYSLPNREPFMGKVEID